MQQRKEESKNKGCPQRPEQRKWLRGTISVPEGSVKKKITKEGTERRNRKYGGAK